MAAAMHYLSKGDDVVLISCNSGTIMLEKNFQHGYQRLKALVGSRIEFAGVIPTAGTLSRLKEQFWNLPMTEVALKYPALSVNQLQCALCQTSMWMAGIVYCHVNGIKTLASGYKATDKFVTGVQQYQEFLRALAEPFSVGLEFPVWEYSDKELLETFICFGLDFTVLEPKCMVGFPSEGPADSAVQAVQALYQLGVTKLHKSMEKLVPIHKSIEWRNYAYVPMCE